MTSWQSGNPAAPKSKSGMLARLATAPVKAKLAARNTLDYTDAKGVRRIRLHDTDILTLRPRGGFTVDTGGWNTHTTRDRLNEFLPAGYRVHTNRARLYLTVPGPTGLTERGAYEFRSTVTVSASGKVKPDVSPKAADKLAKQIDAYMAAWRKRGVKEQNMSGPVLATKKYEEDGDRYALKVYGGLNFLRGNKQPYFSLTGDTWRNGREDTGGCIHETILAHFPQFADLAALHLSDMDGAPSHAAANGWYKLAGCYPDAFGDRYHSGSQDRHFPDGYRKPTGDECLAIFAEHCRIGLDEAAAIRDDVRKVAMASRDNRLAVAKARCAELLDAMRPRWKREADVCIAKHGLVVFGDKWPVAA